mgnify:FL=1
MCFAFGEFSKFKAGVQLSRIGSSGESRGDHQSGEGSHICLGGWGRIA